MFPPRNDPVRPGRHLPPSGALAILLTLQTGEQRITDLTAQLGGSQANISAHLIKLKKSGLITGAEKDAIQACAGTALAK